MKRFDLPQPPTAGQMSLLRTSGQACHDYESSECGTARQHTYGTLLPNREGTDGVRRLPFKGSKGGRCTPAVSSSEKNNDMDAVGRDVTGRVSHELAARAALQHGNSNNATTSLVCLEREREGERERGVQCVG